MQRYIQNRSWSNLLNSKDYLRLGAAIASIDVSAFDALCTKQHINYTIKDMQAVICELIDELNTTLRR